MDRTIKARRTRDALAAEATRLDGYSPDGLWHLADGMVLVSPSRVGVLVKGVGPVEIGELAGITAAARLRGGAGWFGRLLRGAAPMKLTAADQRFYGGAATALDHLRRYSVPGNGTFLWADSYLNRWEAADALEALVGKDPRRQAVLAPSARGTQVIVTNVALIAEAARDDVRWPATDAERAMLAGVTAWAAQATHADRWRLVDELAPRTIGSRRARGIATGVWA